MIFIFHLGKQKWVAWGVRQCLEPHWSVVLRWTSKIYLIVIKKSGEGFNWLGSELSSQDVQYNKSIQIKFQLFIKIPGASLRISQWYISLQGWLGHFRHWNISQVYQWPAPPPNSRRSVPGLQKVRESSQPTKTYMRPGSHCLKPMWVKEANTQPTWAPCEVGWPPPGPCASPTSNMEAREAACKPLQGGRGKAHPMQVKGDGACLLGVWEGFFFSPCFLWGGGVSFFPGPEFCPGPSSQSIPVLFLFLISLILNSLSLTLEEKEEI